MHVDVPFTYEATILRPRKQKPESASYLASVPVEIRELDLKEAPLVAKFECSDHGYKEQIVELRTFEGKLLRASKGFIGKREAEQITRSYILERISEGCESSPLHDRSYKVDDRCKPFADDALVKELVWDNRAEVEAAILGKAASLFLVGDDVWKHCSEPAIFLSRSSFDEYVWAKVGWTNVGSALDTYRLDQADFIRRSRADLIAQAKHFEMPMVEVFLSECLTLDPKAAAVFDASVWIGRQMAEKVAERDDAYFAAFRTLRDALPPFLEDQDKKPPMPADLNVPALAKATRAAFGAHAEWEIRGQGPGRELPSWYQREVRDALTRYELESEEPEVDFGPSFG